MLDIFGQLVNEENRNMPEVQKSIQEIERQYNVKFDDSRNIKTQIFELSERFRMLYTDADSDKVAIMTDHACLRPADVYPKEYYSESIYMPFEYIEVPVPVGYEPILRQKYGDSYMTPRMVRADHDYPFYKKQKKEVYRQMGIEI